MTRYLITGGCGFLGSNIAARLLAEGATVAVFDSLRRVGSIQNLTWLRSRGTPEFIHGDVRNRGDVERVVAGFQPDAVFHLAGQVAMTTSIEDPRLDFETNVLGTVNVLEALRRQRPHAALLYSSTNKVYGDLEALAYAEHETRWALRDYPEGLPEEIGLDFRSPYGCSKGAADQYVLDYARVFGLKTAVFRHSSMYGGRQFATYDQGWIGWFCEQVHLQSQDPRRDPFTISGDGKQVRDVLHADDMVELYLRASDRIEAISGQAFNIGGGMENSLSLLELLSFLGEELSTPPRFERLAPRASDQRVFVADIRKAKRLLGWAPRVGWRDGLRSMLEWVRRGI